MSLNDLLKDYSFTINDCLLKQTNQELTSYDIPEISEMLQNGYKSSDPNIVRSMTLLNAIFTHHAQTFLITKKSFANLLKNDGLSRYNNINSTDYKCFMSTILNNGHFECLRKPSNNKSGVYKLTQKELVENLYKLHSADWFSNQEQKVVNYYDETNKEKETKSIGKTMRDLAQEDGVL